jgi:MOSC domain-containing protein YiiM
MSKAKVIAVSVSPPREVVWNGRTVLTSIFKTPVSGRRAVRRLNIDGDEQSDLTVHGGVDKAVYVYPSEHYSFWKEQLPGVDLPWGSFGENLTTEGVMDDQMRIGDRLRIGSAEFTVTQPRIPCFKLGIRFGDQKMVKRFLKARRPGFYLRVDKEGELGAGDSIELLAAERDSISVVEVTNLYDSAAPDRELLRRAMQLQSLPSGWRDYFTKRVSAAG